MYDRMDSVNSLLQREISGIILKDVKDPRLSNLTSVTSVKTSKNMQSSTIYISVIGESKSKSNSIKALNSAAGFIQRKLRKQLHLRSIPKIRFVIDNSLDEAEKINRIINSHQNTPQ